jgi:hypothetical protein
VEWLLHAQQLPHDIVDIFEKFKINGYDFPELMENNGSLLETQLGITQPHIRKKIVQGMEMKVRQYVFRV